MLPDDIMTVDNDCLIESSRQVAAPVEKVFRAWTEPQYLSRWWGPAGFTNTFHEHDLKVGGTWKFTMHGPEKGHYKNECVFIKIVPPTMIAWNRISDPLFQVAASFEPLKDNNTRITFRMLFDSPELCGKIRPFATEKNEENFDRLEEVLRGM